MPGSSVIATCPKCGEKFKIKLSSQTESGTSGEEEDIRQTASRAYQAEADRFAEEKETFKNDNPWELAPEPSGWTAAFFQTISRVMFSSSRFFSNLPAFSAPLRPLLFYSIIILLQTIMDQLWGRFFISVLEPGAANDPQLAKMLELLSTEKNFILTAFFRFGMMVFQLYLLTLILYFAYRLIAPARSSFSLLFQVMVYSSAPLILCVVPVLGSLVGMLWSLGCCVIGLKAALRLNWSKTLFGLLPLFILAIPIFSFLFNLTF